MSATLEQVLIVTGRIHEAGADTERWPDALTAMMALLQASRGALIEMESQTNRLLHITQVGHDPSTVQRYSEHYYEVDPTAHACLSAPALKAETTYGLFPRSFRERDEYFNFATAANIG